MPHAQVPSGRHLIFYDDQCSFCRWCVQKVITKDKKKLFAFTPLKGKTAKQNLPKFLQKKDSLILIEDFKKGKVRARLRGKAALRILFILGGKWKWLYSLYVLPFFLIDPFYLLIAKNRHLMKKYDAKLKKDSRFLP